MLYLAESFLEYTDERRIPNLVKLTKIYERCRFGPDLIQERDLFEFMIEFDKFGQMCQNDYQNKLPKNQSRRVSRFSRRSSTNFDDTEGGYMSNWDYSSGIFYDSSFELHPEDDDDEDEEEIAPPFQHRAVEAKYFTNLDSASSIADESQESPAGSIRKVKRKDSASSTRSVIRNKLALSSRHTLSSIRRNAAAEMSSLKRETSGYITDSEADFDQESFVDDRPDESSPLSAMDFYGFRKRRSTFVAPDEIQDRDLNISNDEIRNIEFKKRQR
ncbi:uncharacterized protein SPAPADRAFT_58099 [Spathaspora passalidarum NRRL Y-27907]|uniref:Uncharacterized protein n=1 Tax=Spathaspora passalidarum (strain NRRL Y-27907 / 11-Y1) TaxID=619300 RepID=G3AFI6_SPAPN|nr:uncharacterized protein SPAPADRAFT_58099 [Spathaspora passalidarum NRRL Y-27907]EGW34975.1 hypothetical protein SPAPADRAFT_58099 [Spathaspora passalidarum NRRL Y-27907]